MNILKNLNEEQHMNAHKESYDNNYLNSILGSLETVRPGAERIMYMGQLSLHIEIQ